MTLRKHACHLLFFSLYCLFALAGCKTGLHAYSISSASMSPTVNPGDRFFVDQSSAGRANLHDGEIVALRREQDVVVIKRILAMPGETIRGEDRKVFRNGVPVDEPYLAPADKEKNWMPSFPEHKVPPGELFVLGDDRDHSLDSRAPEYAPVRISDVLGEYSYTFWHGAKPAR